MKKPTPVNLVLLILLSVSILFLFYSMLKNQKQIWDSIRMEERNLILRQEIDSLKAVSTRSEYKYKEDIKTIERTYKNKLERIELSYKSKMRDIHELPVTEKVELLSEIIDQPVDLVKIDTNQLVTTTEIGLDNILNIHLKKLEFEDKFLLCSQTNDSLMCKIEDGLEVIESKNVIISKLEKLDKGNKMLIEGLNKEHKKEIRKYKIDIVKVGGVSLLLGVGIGTLLFL